jgi:S-adenosylmethionine-diacylgycerolhomoserine-N-methlytransferase
MGLASDLRVLYRLAFARVRGDTHAERLEAFYRHQAPGYDDFRKRLLHGREEMIQALEVPEGGHLLDMGGGTGSNAELFGERLSRLGSMHIVDLCPSLLTTAEERIQHHGWVNVHTAHADATTYVPTRAPVDVVTFSYSLTMIPDWFRAMQHAWNLLRPGGTIGVVDFYVSRKWPAPGLRRHSGLQRLFWQAWFGMDNVFLSPDHLPYLQAHFETVRLEERKGKVPYLLGLQAPYYIFIGRKPVAAGGPDRLEGR